MAKRAAATNDSGPATTAAVLIRPDIQIIRVTIVGTSPLIAHNWDPEVIAAMDHAQQRKGSKARKAADPEREFQTGRYLDGKGRDCILARAVKAAMVAYATSLNNRQFSKTLLRQAFFVQGDLIPMRCSTPVRRRDVCRMKKTGGACVRYRPEYETWEADLVIDFNRNAISVEELLELLEGAGYGVGIHDWRPEKNGNSGRFGVKTR